MSSRRHLQKSPLRRSPRRSGRPVGGLHFDPATHQRVPAPPLPSVTTTTTSTRSQPIQPAPVAVPDASTISLRHLPSPDGRQAYLDAPNALNRSPSPMASSDYDLPSPGTALNHAIVKSNKRKRDEEEEVLEKTRQRLMSKKSRGKGKRSKEGKKKSKKGSKSKKDKDTVINDCSIGTMVESYGPIFASSSGSRRPDSS
ncbi:hypothetical protein JCM5353_006354, partial [Sporobolomyces roseus]